jgi:beta-galactosidase/beta-glucuronidase
MMHNKGIQMKSKRSKRSTCKHCGQPIRTVDGEWVHDDPDENPKQFDYGWVKCLPDDDGSFECAEPK